MHFFGDIQHSTAPRDNIRIAEIRLLSRSLGVNLHNVQKIVHNFLKGF